ncbi:MAG: hypothetical protein ACK4TL_11845 [Hyphomicrobiaceae bacterium]
MAVPMRDEVRALSDDELEMVVKTHIPLILDLSDAELADLTRQVREKRKRARDIANRQRREMRGKAERPGAAPARDNSGTKHKAAVLAGALKRLNNEKERRARLAAVPEQVRFMRKALQLKRASGKGHSGPSYRTASRGMRNIENEKTARLIHPMEIGRVSQFVRAAQAKRDWERG